MPKLNKLDCSIELGPSNTRLKEYGACYSDSHVEIFLVVPATDMPFTIHLKSEGYIAPGLAVFVYMDAVYQCNRNRTGLKLPGGGVHRREYETEFRIRQKEERAAKNGSFIARDWTFARLNRGMFLHTMTSFASLTQFDIVAADKAPSINPQFISNVGTIEVVVLRCLAGPDDIPLPRAERKETIQVNKEDSKQAGIISKGGPRSSKKSVTIVSPPPNIVSPSASDIGFGALFDGTTDIACNDAGLDGANDWTQLHNRQHPKPVLGPNAQDPAELRIVATQLELLKTWVSDGMYEGAAPNIALRLALKDASSLQQLLTILRAPDAVSNFPVWLKEVILDLEAMRHYIQALEQHCPELDYSFLKHQLLSQQVEACRDAKLRRRYHHTLYDVLDLAATHKDRLTHLHNFLETVENLGVDSRALHQRIERISREYEGLRNMAKPLVRIEQQGLEQLKAQVQSSVNGRKATQKQASGWFDTAHLAQAGDHRDRPAVQQVGVGVWDPAAKRQAGWESCSRNKSNVQQAGAGSFNSARSQPNNLWAANDGFAPDARRWFVGDKEQKSLIEQPKNSSHNAKDAGVDAWGAQNDAQNQQASGRANAWENRDAEQESSSKSKENADEDGGWNDDKPSQKPSTGHDGAWGGDDAWDNSTAQPKAKPRTDKKTSKSIITSAEGKIKSYWKTSVPQPTTISAPSPRDVYVHPTTPLPRLPADEAKGAATHGIQTSRGADYTHGYNAPVYIDSMDAPYAVFSFKYRSKAALERILKIKIDEGEVRRVEGQMRRDRFEGMSRTRLVEELMKQRVSDGRGRSGGGGGSKKDSGQESTKEKPDDGEWGTQGEEEEKPPTEASSWNKTDVQPANKSGSNKGWKTPKVAAGNMPVGGGKNGEGANAGNMW